MSECWNMLWDSSCWDSLSLQMAPKELWLMEMTSCRGVYYCELLLHANCCLAFSWSSFARFSYMVCWRSSIILRPFNLCSTSGSFHKELQFMKEKFWSFEGPFYFAKWDLIIELTTFESGWITEMSCWCELGSDWVLATRLPSMTSLQCTRRSGLLLYWDSLHGSGAGGACSTISRSDLFLEGLMLVNMGTCGRAANEGVTDTADMSCSKCVILCFLFAV